MFPLPDMTPDIPFSSNIPREAMDVRSVFRTFIKMSFFIFSFSFPFFLDRAHRDLPEDQNARSVSKLRTQCAALHKIFCDTKCKQGLKEWGEENKSNNSEN